MKKHLVWERGGGSKKYVKCAFFGVCIPQKKNPRFKTLWKKSTKQAIFLQLEQQKNFQGIPETQEPTPIGPKTRMVLQWTIKGPVKG